MDSSNVLDLTLVAGISLVGAISPGPTLLVIVKNSLLYSRQSALWTIVGVSIGLIGHLTYTLVGIGILLAQSVHLYQLIKYAGAAYLFYLGIRALRFTRQESSLPPEMREASQALSKGRAIRQGFLVSCLNAETAIYFLSLFSQFITIETPVWLRLEYAAVNWSVSLLWYVMVAYLITGEWINVYLARYRAYIDKTVGTCLLFLSLNIVFS